MATDFLALDRVDVTTHVVNFKNKTYIFLNGFIYIINLFFNVPPESAVQIIGTGADQKYKPSSNPVIILVKWNSIWENNASCLSQSTHQTLRY